MGLNYERTIIHHLEKLILLRKKHQQIHIIEVLLTQELIHLGYKLHYVD